MPPPGHVGVRFNALDPQALLVLWHAPFPTHISNAALITVDTPIVFAYLRHGMLLGCCHRGTQGNVCISS